MTSLIASKFIDRPGFNKTELDAIKEAFDLFDVENNGRINIKEFRETMKNLGHDREYPIIYRVIADLDTPQNNKKGVDYETIVEAYNRRLGDMNTEEGISRLFNLYTTDSRSNQVTREGIEQRANELKEQTDNREAQSILEKTARNGTDMTYDEFNYMLTEKTFP